MIRIVCLMISLLALVGLVRADECADFTTAPRVTDVRAQEGAVTALAAAGDHLVVGLETGDIKLYDLSSRPWQPYRRDTVDLGATPTAAALAGGLVAAVTAAPGRLHLFASAGDLLAPLASPLALPGDPLDVALLDGRAYVLSADTDTSPWRSWLTSVDLSDPTAPSVTDLREVPYPATALDASAGLLAVTSTAEPNLQLFVLGDPPTPRPVGTWHGGGLVRDVVLDGGDALLAGADGTWTVNVDAPAAPVLRHALAAVPGWARAARAAGLDVLLRTAGQGGEEGLQALDGVTGSPLASLAPHGATLTAVAGWAYVGRGGDLVTVELKAAAAPTAGGGLEVEAAGDVLRGLAVDGARGLALVEREAATRLWSLDLADPSAPRREAVIGLTGTPLALALAGDLAAVGVSAVGSQGGVHLIDLSDPAAPQLLGTLSVPGDPTAVGFRGAVLDVLVRAVDAAVTDRWLRWSVSVPTAPQATTPVYLPNPPGALLADPATETVIVVGDGLFDIYDVAAPLQPQLSHDFLTSLSFLSLARDGEGRLWGGLAGGLLVRVDLGSPEHLMLTDAVWLSGDPAALLADGPRLWAACGDLALLEPVASGAPVAVGEVGAGACAAVAAVEGGVLVAAGTRGLRFYPSPCGNVAAEPDVESDAPPAILELGAPYPNPFNPTVWIPFALDRPGRVLLEVLDAAGRRVAVPAQGVWPAGRQAVVWDGRGPNGRLAPSGVYLVRLRHGDEVRTRKMELLR